MKYLLILLPFFSVAQEPAEGVFPVKDGKIYYEKVFNVDSTSKNELFSRAREWALTAFVSQKNALQTEDKEDGYIFYKTQYNNTFVMNAGVGRKSESKWAYDNLVKIYIKDGKAKISIQEISLNAEGYPNNSVLTFREDNDSYLKKMLYGKGYREVIYKSARSNFIETNQFFMGMMANFETAINKKSASTF